MADQAPRCTDQNYGVELALITKLDAIFNADVLGVYDGHEGDPEASIREAMQTPVNLHSEAIHFSNKIIPTIK